MWPKQKFDVELSEIKKKLAAEEKRLQERGKQLRDIGPVRARVDIAQRASVGTRASAGGAGGWGSAIIRGESSNKDIGVDQPVQLTIAVVLVTISAILGSETSDEL